jgi:hypothetical protein
VDLVQDGPASQSLVQGQFEGKLGLLFCVRCSGLAAFILGHLGRQGTTAFPPASRVGFSELLGCRELVEFIISDGLRELGATEDVPPKRV